MYACTDMNVCMSDLYTYTFLCSSAHHPSSAGLCSTQVDCLSLTVNTMSSGRTVRVLLACSTTNQHTHEVQDITQQHHSC